MTTDEQLKIITHFNNGEIIRSINKTKKTEFTIFKAEQRNSYNWNFADYDYVLQSSLDEGDWKQRCELAEIVINESNQDRDYPTTYANAFSNWENYKFMKRFK